ncbi:MAG: ATP-binding protein [Saprospiraceae bacterium]|nr:ATP-binding protein [Saprospiraceae bacterium]
MIPRFASEKLLSLLQRFPAVGLLGPRQVGKTTLAKSLAPLLNKPTRYFDLERLEDYQRLQNDPGFFLEQYQDECVIIDEVQRLPGLFAELRSLIDRKRNPGRFLLLGSASPLLLKQTADSLAGRIAYVNLAPLHQNELHLAAQDLRRHWWRGGFPDSWLPKEDAWSHEWREQFVRTYVERDLPFLGLNTDPIRFRMFLQLLAANHGNLWNAESIGRSLGISGNTVKHYLEFLESSFFVQVLRPYFVNMGKRLVKSPKVYIADSGLLHALGGIQRPDDLPIHPLAGASWEGYVISQILTLLPTGVEPYFYRTSDGTECDLVLMRGMEPLTCIEIKLGNVAPISKGFRNVINTLGSKKNYLINYSSESYRAAEDITVTGIRSFLTQGLPELWRDGGV